MPRNTMSRWLHILTLTTFAASAHVSIGSCDEQDSRALIVVDGTAVSAAIGELRPDWSVAVRVADHDQAFARSEYVLWGGYADNARSSQVLLADESVLVGDIARIEADSITLVSKLWGELQINRQLMRGCLLLPAADPLERDRQWQLLQSPQTADRVLLLNGDAIAGKLLPTEERDGGGLFGLTSIGIELSGSGTITSVHMDEVRAIAFQTHAAHPPQPECWLGFRDGSLLSASTLTQSGPEITQLTTVASVSLRLPTDEVRENLTFIQPRNEAVTFLSDLPAVGYKSLPFLSLDWPLGIAANTLGGRLRSGGHIMLKGIGMHSDSRVAYTLDRRYQRFEAELALDDRAERQGSVVYRVLVERDDAAGQSTWQLAFTSPIIRGGDTPLAIEVDVNEATRIALVVEMADRTDVRDYANWLNARLVLRPQ